MNRKPHVLEPNKSSQRPCHVIFFDCETSPIKISDKEDRHVLRLGWACYQRTAEKWVNRKPEWYSFTTKQQFWAFVEKHVRPKTKLYLVAHNVAFDFRIVEGFDYTKRNGWNLTFFYNKGKTCLLTYRRNKTTIQVLDMTNFFPMSLERVGKAIGLEKGKVDFAAVDEGALSDYCKRDVEVMIKAWEAWIAFLDDHELGNFKHTLPAQAFNAYRHRFMPYKIHIHNDESVCELERDAYRGGRTEVFWKGTRKGGKYYQLDVNGMYAYVMQTKRYPTKLLRKRETVSLRKLTQLSFTCAVVARVVIETNQAVFPIRGHTRNIYPIGRFETVLTTPELQYAIENNMIVEVKQTAWYRAKPIFCDYSTYFSKLKEQYGREERGAFRVIAKLFGNSLYGKFGQRGMKTTIRKDVPQKQRVSDSIARIVGIEQLEPPQTDHPDDCGKRKLITRKIGRSYRLGGDYILEEHGGESYNSFPAIAAHVTAYARMYLWNLFRLAGRRNVYYCDTDCMIVNQAGYDSLLPLLDDHALGYLKVEKQGNALTIHAAKDYKLGDKQRTKGIRKDAKRLAPNRFEQDQFLGLAGAIQREQPDLVTIKKTIKSLSRTVKTGNVGFDGWVTPFRLPL